MAINQNQKIWFSGEKSPYIIISEILEKNNLKETLNDMVDKIGQGQVSRIIILYKLSRDIAGEKIYEKDFILAIQDQLKTTTKIAQDINKDIKEKLLPLAQKINIVEQKSEEKVITMPAPIQTEKIPTKETGYETNQKPIKLTKTITKIPEIKEVKNTTKKSDSYRETIE
ncbi:MAG: hypothetical protein NTY81_01635 [Candidatus Staskawiczbacteria bacterium]|nr:hypothetical protein [Candidatus Staskawiczbacteria bacterium]